MMINDFLPDKREPTVWKVTPAGPLQLQAGWPGGVSLSAIPHSDYHPVSSGVFGLIKRLVRLADKLVNGHIH